MVRQNGKGSNVGEMESRVGEEGGNSYETQLRATALGT